MDGTPALEGPMCTCAKLLQSCPILCDPMDCSPPGSSVHGIPHAKHWSRLPCPPLGDLPNPGTESASPVSSALARRFFTTSTTCEAPGMCIHMADSLCCTIETNTILTLSMTIKKKKTVLMKEDSQSSYSFICQLNLSNAEKIKY